MFIQTFGAMLTSNGWSLVNNHLLLNIIYISPAGKEFLEAIDTLGHIKNVVYITDVIKRY